MMLTKFCKLLGLFIKIYLIVVIELKDLSFAVIYYRFIFTICSVIIVGFSTVFLYLQ